MGSSKLQFPRGGIISPFDILDYRRNGREIRTIGSQVEMVGAVVGDWLVLAESSRWAAKLLRGCF